MAVELLRVGFRVETADGPIQVTRIVYTAGSGGHTLAPYLGQRIAECLLLGSRPDDVASMGVVRFEDQLTADGTTAEGYHWVRFGCTG